MAKVTIYRFKKYDVTTDEDVISRRWGTRQGIQDVGGVIIEDSGVVADESVVKSNIDGLTERGFNPHAHTGFQKQVI